MEGRFQFRTDHRVFAEEGRVEPGLGRLRLVRGFVVLGEVADEGVDEGLDDGDGGCGRGADHGRRLVLRPHRFAELPAALERPRSGAPNQQRLGNRPEGQLRGMAGGSAMPMKFAATGRMRTDHPSAVRSSVRVWASWNTFTMRYWLPSSSRRSAAGTG